MGDHSMVMAPIQLLDYAVSKLHFDTSHDAVRSEPLSDVKFDIGFDFRFQPGEKGSDIHGMEMEVTISGYRKEQQDENDEPEDKESGKSRPTISLALSIVGLFRLEEASGEKPPTDVIANFFFATSVSSLYGIAREKVKQITSQSKIPSIVLPVVNVGAICEALVEDQDLAYFEHKAK
jgi:hypothetical protein